MRVARSHGGDYVLACDEARHVASRINGRTWPTRVGAPPLRAGKVGGDDRRRLADLPRPTPLPTDAAAAPRLVEEPVAEWF
jgi:hypothetical protein